VAKTITVSDSTDLLPDPQVARRYNVNPRTIYRWDDQPALGFPKPIRINNRKYRRLHELEAWERQRVEAA
jgi:predicted DNA-binding transcriptional regulator AlpA